MLIVSSRLILSILPLFIVIINTNASILTQTPRACIVGAGYSGLGTARYLKQYGVNFTLFEATKYVGGIWRYDPHVGVDEDGIPIYANSYVGLRLNTPKQFMEYYDFPFPEDTPSYMEGTCMYKYLLSFVENFNLLENIQFKSLVTSIRWAEDHWNLTYLKADVGQNVTETCDYVVISTGLYIKPQFSDIKGQELFEGSIIHSHEYKTVEPYVNRRVLILGSGASGMDITVQLSNVASRVFHSHRKSDFFTNVLPAEVYLKKPDVVSFTSNGAVFDDGTFEEFDDVILCTGYIYDYPFLDSTAGLILHGKVVAPLYRHFINIHHPSMMIIGMTRNISNTAIDAQSHYAAASISGSFQLPSRKIMMKTWVEENLWMPLAKVNYVLDTDKYHEILSKEANIPRIPPVYSRMAWENNYYRITSFLTFRNYRWDIIDDYNYERYYAPTEELTCPIDI